MELFPLLKEIIALETYGMASVLAPGTQNTKEIQQQNSENNTSRNYEFILFIVNFTQPY